MLIMWKESVIIAGSFTDIHMHSVHIIRYQSGVNEEWHMICHSKAKHCCNANEKDEHEMRILKRNSGDFFVVGIYQKAHFRFKMHWKSIVSIYNMFCTINTQQQLI